MHIPILIQVYLSIWQQLRNIAKWLAQRARQDNATQDLPYESIDQVSLSVPRKTRKYQTSAAGKDGTKGKYTLRNLSLISCSYSASAPSLL